MPHLIIFSFSFHHFYLFSPFISCSRHLISRIATAHLFPSGHHLLSGSHNLSYSSYNLLSSYCNLSISRYLSSSSCYLSSDCRKLSSGNRNLLPRCRKFYLAAYHLLALFIIWRPPVIIYQSIVISLPLLRTATNYCIAGAIVIFPDSKIHGANVGPTWGHKDPGGPHVGHTNLVIWVVAIIWISRPFKYISHSRNLSFICR